MAQPNFDIVYFTSMCLKAIGDMQRAGMSDMLIGCVLQEVRAAALSEESMRRANLLMNNPPHHPPAQTYAGALPRR